LLLAYSWQLWGRWKETEKDYLLNEGLQLKNILVSFLSLFLLTTFANAEVADFEALTLDAESYWNGADGSGGFTSGGASFNNFYDDTFGPYWEGFAYSNMTDTQTRGYDNQYSAITASGVNGSSNYAVAYTAGFYGTTPTVTFVEPITVSGAYFTNTTYAFWTLMEGDAFAKKFGGETGDDPDWFKLTITGKDGEDNPTGTVDFYLADYRFGDNTRDYIVHQWTWVDLSSLGDVKSLAFTLTSSDTGDFGMNTPGYFAMDHLNGFSFAAGSDLDGDGIPDDQEVDPSVDLNNDGIPDLFQSEIKCVNTVVGNGQMGLSIEGSAATEIVEIRSVNPPCPIPEGVTIPLGLLSFTLKVSHPGDQVVVKVYLSEPAATGAKWYKYDAVNGWWEYPHATFSPDGTFVDLELKDGELDLGDVDMIENKIIVDPSGPGLPPAAALPDSPATGEAADSSGRGSLGCFVGTAASGWALKVCDTCRAILVWGAVAGGWLALRIVRRKE
jgi:hypothetical protein